MKKLNNMRLKTFLLFFTVALFSSNLVFSQLLVNKGSTIKVTKGAVLYIDGGLENNNSGIIDVDNIGGTSEIIVKENFVNYATAEGSGYYKIYGDWVNNNTFNAGSGTVFLEGANQLISGSHSTNFYNLTLNGSGIKTLGVNQSCSNVLSLNDLELNTLNYKFYVTNPATTAITRVNGFVSSTNGGFLSRTTNSNGIYLFPVGSSTGTNRYRPVEIQPTNTSVNTYTVRFANVDPTTEFYNTNQLASDICEVNSNFYHQINRSSGTSSANVSVFYDPATDGIWEGLANWKINQWQIVAGSQNQTTTPLSKAIVNNWNDFSSMPYSLYRNIPTINITHPGDLCQGDAEITLTATPAGGTWSGTGITDAINGTYNPNTEGTHTITYTIAGTCGASNSISIIVKPTPTINITDPGDFCSTDPSSSFTATPTGGTWSGTGITNQTNGTFNPETAGAGEHTITYTVTQNGCTGEESITINVIETPDATITSTVTTMCTDNDPITLTATTPGGNWTGTGVTTDGVFDPEIAGVGEHTITYTVSTGTCTDNAQITITVSPTPDINITKQDDLCLSDSEVTLSATPAGGTWSGPGITNATNGTFNPEVAGPGEHTITYTVESPCLGSATTVITVSSPTQITIINYVCSDTLPIFFNANIDGGTWSGNGIVDANTGEFDPEVAGVGEHTITYAINNPCGGTVTTVIQVYQRANAEILPVDTLFVSDLPVFVETVETGGTWSGTGIDETTGLFTPNIAGVGDHQVYYTIPAPCGDIDSTVVIVIPDIIPDLIIPDVLTPNNDGYNDTWRIQGIQAYEKIEIYIFNRWGDEVFTYSGSGFDYNDPAKQWDGTFKGKLLPFGTYVYVLILNDETSYKSTVTIIR